MYDKKGDYTIYIMYICIENLLIRLNSIKGNFSTISTVKLMISIDDFIILWIGTFTWEIEKWLFKYPPKITTEYNTIWIVPSKIMNFKIVRHWLWRQCYNLICANGYWYRQSNYRYKYHLWNDGNGEHSRTINHFFLYRIKLQRLKTADAW